MPDGGDVAEEVAGVRVLGHQAERPPLARTSDQDGDPAGAHRPGEVQGAVDPVVPALEGGLFLGEHGPADLDRLLEPAQALPGRGELEPQSFVFVFVPRGPDTEDGPARGHDVEGGDDLGQVGRVSVRHARDHGAEGGPRGPRGDAAEQRVGLEHGLGARSHVGDLIEVVHHPHRVEAGLLCGDGDLGHAIEQLTVGNAWVGEIGDLKPEPKHLLRTLPPSDEHPESAAIVPVVP